MAILDIGCGPGTVSVDLARCVPQGSVTGIDTSSSVLERARAHAEERAVRNVSFATGDIYALDFSDQKFDVVHVHQVLQHLGDPVRALREMRRVTKRGGIVACREADMTSAVWYPDVESMQHFHQIYARCAKGLGGNPDAGRKIHAYARIAGFQRLSITTSSSTWCFSTPQERKFWCEMWADRITQSELKSNLIDGGHASEKELAEMRDMWLSFAEEEDGWYTLVHGEIICRR